MRRLAAGLLATALLLALLLNPRLVAAPAPSSGRSGAVATSHYLATEAGMEILNADGRVVFHVRMPIRRAVGACATVLFAGAALAAAQPQDYEIHGGSRVSHFRVGVPVARMTALLGREEASGSWRTPWGQGKALYWPSRGVNAKVCGRSEEVVEVNVYAPPLPAEALKDLMVEIGRYQIKRQFGIRTPSFLLPEYFGEPDTRRIVPSLLGATRVEMYWYDLGLHMEAESGEVMEIGAVVIPPRCP